MVMCDVSSKSVSSSETEAPSARTAPGARRKKSKVKARARAVIDLALIGMLVFEMLIDVTGVFLHEVIGFAMIEALIAHIVLSWGFVKGVHAARRNGKRLRPRQAVARAIIIVLAVDVAALAVSSVIVSNLIALTGLDLSWANPRGIAGIVHGISAWTLCVLAVVHVALHFSRVTGMAKIPYDRSRRQAIGTGVWVVAGVCAAVLGFKDVSYAAARIPYALGRNTSVVDAVVSGSESTLTSNDAESAVPQITLSEKDKQIIARGMCPICHRHCYFAVPLCGKAYEYGLTEVDVGSDRNLQAPDENAQSRVRQRDGSGKRSAA
jgi:branched-subunit amino acid transport protein